MDVPIASAEMVAQSSTLVDYVQFDQWKMTDCFSSDEQFQVSASYAMGIVFNRGKGAYKESDGKSPNLVEIAPSFFTSNNNARVGCYNYGHGIVFEGCWVTYDGRTMRGSSRRRLPIGESFTTLCQEWRFRKWFSKVLNGDYKGYDFDTLPLDILTSLTSPNTPGSLASDNPAGSRPSAGLPTPDNQVVALARRVAPDIMLKIGFPTPKKSAACIKQGADACAPLALTNPPASQTLEKAKTAKLRADTGLSIGNNDQAVADRAVKPSKGMPSLRHLSNKSTATAKEGKATLARDGSQPVGHAAVKPLAVTQPSGKPTTSMKRKNASPSTSSPDKRAKTGPAYQQPKDVIAISSSDEEEEEKVKLDPDDPQSSNSATQNQKLMKEIAILKLSESRAVDRANEALEKIEKLMQENTNLKLAEMRAVNRANEALGKLRAANRANEELGGNEDLVGQIEGLMRENASLKLSALRPADGTDGAMDRSKDIPHRIKSESNPQQIKKENGAGQREKQT